MKNTGLFVMVLLALFAADVSQAQEMSVTGIVKDAEEAKAIPGVTVQVLGTDQGTISDGNGLFRISVPNANAILVFSFVGMQTQERLVGEQTSMEVILVPDVRQLSEIVVTGAGIPVEKRNLAFSVEAVKSSSLPQVPTASIDQALIGRIPGAQISSVSGTPGAEVSILLRGINSVNRDFQPIIMVDGVQMAATQFNALDPATIERVEVVQGAAAATIYGAQGANGVIQVFTKRGKPGRVAIDISMQYGVSQFLNVGGLRKSRHHGFTTNSNNDVVLSSDTTQLLTQNDTTLLYGSTFYNLLDSLSTWDKPYNRNLTYHDHFSEFMKPAPFQALNVTFSGGNDKTDFSIGLSRMRQESTFSGSGYNERTNLAINVGTEVAKGLQLRSITQLIYHQNTLSLLEKPEFWPNGIFFTLLNTQPFVDYWKRDVDGNYGLEYGDIAGINMENPNYHWQYTSTLDSRVDILQNISVAYQLPRYVRLELLYGINYQNRDVRYEANNQSLNRNSVAGLYWASWNNFNDNTGEITTYTIRQTFQNFKATATVDLDFANDFGWKIPLKSTTQVAYDYRGDNSSRLESYALGMPVIPPISIIQGTSFGVWQDDKVEFVTYGYLVNQRFQFGEFAGLSGGFRSDYSSAFGKGSKPFTFPRADAYVRVSELPFWNSSGLSKRLPEWKLRAAYGEAGIQPQPFDRYVTLGSKAVGSSNALFIPREQSNPELNVEVSREFELGTDLFVDGFTGNWLKNAELSLSWWTRSTDNAIWNVPAPPSTGVLSRLENALGLESDGFQASLNARIYRGNAFGWRMTVNFSHQQSVVSKVVGDEIIVGNRILKPGSAIGEFYGWMLLHDVNQLKPDGTPFIPASEASLYEVASNGWVVNRTTKQAFISDERFALGNANPDYLWSVINDFTFKEFLTASVQLDGSVGNEMYNETRQWLYRDAIHSDYEKPLTINGKEGAWSAFYRSVYNPAKWDKNYFVEDASFIRLRTVSVAFDFARAFRIAGIKRLQLVLTGRNLWTSTSYSGLDPEVSSFAVPNPNYGSANQALTRGVDSAALPNSRSYQVTLNIGL